MSNIDRVPEKHLNLTICSTSGVAWTTGDFRADTTVNEVIKKAVDHFVAEGAMDAGDYRIALVVYGYANPPLDENANLADTHVANGSLLALVANEPQDDR